MQSGISVSQELHTAFNDLVSSPSTTRGILAKISAESIVPHSTIPTTTGSDFHSDLSALTLHLTPTQAFYIILRRHNDSPSGFVAVTYVPDSAPVRSKMLFASTRLTLVRELGLERFREQLFVTEAAELTKAGWERHEASGALKAPLTEEEQTLQGVKEAEAQARGGTQGKQLETGGKLTMAMSEDARTALAGLKDGLPGTLVQLSIDISNERILLAESPSTHSSPDDLSTAISSTSPRYSFYNYSPSPSESQPSTALIFIYTCPPGAKVKERMLYAASKIALLSGAKADIGLNVEKRFEHSTPDEMTSAVLAAEFDTAKSDNRAGFARPKRPGRR